MKTYPYHKIKFLKNLLEINQKFHFIIVYNDNTEENVSLDENDFIIFELNYTLIKKIYEHVRCTGNHSMTGCNKSSDSIVTS